MGGYQAGCFINRNRPQSSFFGLPQIAEHIPLFFLNGAQAASPSSDDLFQAVLIHVIFLSFPDPHCDLSRGLMIYM